MNITLRLLISVAIATTAAGTSCSKQTNETQVAARAEARAVQVAMADPVPEETSENSSASATAYGVVSEKARELNRQAATASSQTASMKLIGEIETLFSDFIKEYSESDEANDARFQLGTLYFALQRMDQAAEKLSAFVDNSEDKAKDEVGFAHYYLGESYKALDKFEKARKHFNIVLAEYGGLHQQVVATAKASLQDLDTLKKLRIGGEPIPFDVKGIDGRALSLEKYRGKVVLIDFWATWCAPCRVEMPNVVRLHKKFRDKGFEIIGVSLDRDRGAMENYLKSSGMEWPQYFDGGGWNNRIAAKYKVRSIPATYLIDRQGKIRYRTLRGKELEKAVEELVKEQA